MQFFICDDRPEDRAILKAYLETYAKQQSMDSYLTEFSSAEDLLGERFDRSDEPVLLFLDIYMGGLSGMEAAKQLRMAGFSGSLVFTTTSVEHAVESYEVEADGYLKKPYDYAAFEQAMERCRQRWAQSLRTLTVLCDRVEFPVCLRDIAYLESGDHCCLIHAKGEVLKASHSLGYLSDQLSGEAAFLRLGRSFLVNLNAVARWDDEFLYLKTSQRIPLPVRERAKFKRLIAEYYWTATRNVGYGDG